jgi:hypothetical protein
LSIAQDTEPYEGGLYIVFSCSSLRKQLFEELIKFAGRHKESFRLVGEVGTLSGHFAADIFLRRYIIIDGQGEKINIWEGEVRKLARTHTVTMAVLKSVPEEVRFRRSFLKRNSLTVIETI